MATKTQISCTKKKYYACVELAFSFRSIPHTMRQTQTGTHYVQGGRIEINFRAFGLDEDEVKAVEEQEIFEGLEYVEGITTDTIEQIQEDIKKYLEDEEEPEDPRERVKFLERLLRQTSEKNVKREIQKKIKQIEKEIVKKESPPGPFSSLISGFKEVKNFVFKSKRSDSFISQQVRNTAKATAAENAYRIYHVYKKTHGMLNE